MRGSLSPFLLWFIGIPSAGKSTIAKAVVEQLGQEVELLDSDELRLRLTPTPDWSDTERGLFYRALWEIGQRLARRRVSVVVAASGGGIDLDTFRQTSVVPTFFAHVDCNLGAAATRRSGELYRAAAAGRIRLPLVRVRDGIADSRDVAFCTAHGIRAYELVLPRPVDLTLDGTQPPTENVSKVLSFLRQREALDRI